MLLTFLGLTALFAGPITTEWSALPLRTFLNDDYLFLEEARTRPLTQSLTRDAVLGNYFRPLSRQLYFKTLTPVAGESPLAFHLVNYAIYLIALALLFDLLRALLPLPGAMAGALYFAVLPFQRVNLTWVSCSQDLIALAGSLGALALFRRGRTSWAMLAYLAALGGKEMALPLPIALAAWSLGIEHRDARATARRVAPFAILALLWCGVIVLFRAGNPARAPLHFAPTNFVAAYVHMIQALLGLDHPPGIARALMTHGPALLPLVPFAALALWIGAGAAKRGGSSARSTLVFAAVWLAAFGFMVGPAVSTWSSYYYTVPAVGGAMLVGLALARIDRWSWVALCAGLLWWHVASGSTRAFAVVDRPWGWTSHLTTFYFERGAELTEKMRRELVELEPRPPRGTSFFFVTLPSWAGFQLGNGPLVRAVYRDSSLRSHFYSQFSDTTAAGRPYRIVYWDGVRFEPLYENARDPLFQVGTDLMLLDHPGNAAYAFRRALGEGGDRMDNLYWLGWAELFRGNRSEAEQAWTRYGAHDDSLYWMAHLRAAHMMLTTRHDTLEARRHLIKAIEFGIGRPEAHAVLGSLLMEQRTKYALLELQVASWLKPDDWISRRDLFLGLVRVRLDDPARRELRVLERIDPQWSSDTTLVSAARRLERRAGARGDVAEF
jgi:hypothetical protein